MTIEHIRKEVYEPFRGGGWEMHFPQIVFDCNKKTIDNKYTKFIETVEYI